MSDNLSNTIEFNESNHHLLQPQIKSHKHNDNNNTQFNCIDLNRFDKTDPTGASTQPHLQSNMPYRGEVQRWAENREQPFGMWQLDRIVFVYILTNIVCINCAVVMCRYECMSSMVT